MKWAPLVCRWTQGGCLPRDVRSPQVRAAASSSALSALGCHLPALLTATAVLRHSDLLKPLKTSSNLHIFHATELFLQLPIAYKSQCSVDFDGRRSFLLHVTTFPKSVYFSRAFQFCHVTFVLYSYMTVFYFPDCINIPGLRVAELSLWLVRHSFKLELCHLLNYCLPAPTLFWTTLWFWNSDCKLHFSFANQVNVRPFLMEMARRRVAARRRKEGLFFFLVLFSLWQCVDHLVLVPTRIKRGVVALTLLHWGASNKFLFP